jgi:sirohydrochlorin cobaltochelatase
MIEPMAADVTTDERRAFEMLESRLRTLLPAEYQDSYQEVRPVSMGSAGLQYDADGNVAWDRIWGSFCDLAMAGGPPHKGTLLEPGTEVDIDAQFGRYDAVVDEISRGIRMATGLRAYPSPDVGWVHVTCTGESMAEWLLRAIVMENVAVRRAGSVLALPAAPHFRVEKEIKNVITVIAKTAHYWLGHMPPAQQREIGDLFMRMAVEHPLLAPDGAVARVDEHRTLRSAISEQIARETGLRAADRQYVDWLGIDCPDVSSAVWMMRALVASNVLSRREERALFVPVAPSRDPDGARAAAAVAFVHRYASARGIFQQPSR